MMHAQDLDGTVRNWRGPLAAPRLGVYRNNVTGALIGALRVRYPATERLMGADAFAAAAARFAEAQRPDSPVLIHYGERFPATLDDAALRDVALLENLWWTAYHSAEAEALEAAALAALTPEQWVRLRFTLHPSLGLMQADHDAAGAWAAAREGCMTVPAPGRQFILVVRPQASVDIHVLPPASYDFLMRISSGCTLAEAVEGTSGAHPGFDITAAIQGLFLLRLVIGLET